jgi:nucleotide-binding universal stress UspA family protein
MLHQVVRPQLQEPRTGAPIRRDVVVADDGGWGSRRALEQAGQEADLRGVGLVVATVRTTPFVEPTGYASWARAEHDAMDHANNVNVAAQRRVRDARPGLSVDGVVVSSIDDLAPVAEHAGLLVLGRNGASGQGVFRMGTTSGDLAKIFSCPVLVCGDDRSTQPYVSAPSSRHPEVVAAVQVTLEVPTVLRQAVLEAATRRMPLCVLSAGRTQSNAVVEEELAREESVHWRLVWTTGEVLEGLLRYADPDDLLVLGNRGRERLAGHVTGSLTRAVLDSMPCDVMLVPV